MTIVGESETECTELTTFELTSAVILVLTSARSVGS